MERALATLLAGSREAVVERWRGLVLDTYPAHTAQFLAKQKDRFRNPVGHAIDQALGPIYDEVISTMDTDAIRAALDGIIKIRSVQDFTPSQAVGFVFGLKRVMRDVLGPDLAAHEGGLTALEARIDRVAVLAFDKYVECRENVHEIRLREIKRASGRLADEAKAPSGNSPCNGESCR